MSVELIQFFVVAAALLGTLLGFKLAEFLNK